MNIDTEKYKKKLGEEKALLTEELSSIGHVNPKNPVDWVADPDNKAVPETADKNLLADRHENYEKRVDITATLEERLNNVNLALTRIEEGVYGTCSVDGGEIEEDRLDANAAATTCKEHINS